MEVNSWSILKLLNTTAQFFDSRGIETSRLDAEILLGHCLGKGRVELYLQYDCPVMGEELARYRELVKRRVRREPVAYITGVKEFWSTPFRVSRKVLIPRPETETLLEIALKTIPRLQIECERPLLLDLGTGCGALAICLARELKRERARIFASDISMDALRIARENALKLGCGEEVSFILADLFPPIKMAGIDLVICNPPYIPTCEIHALEAEIRDFEPREAIDGGTDGLASIKRIIAGSHATIRSGGTLLMEIGPSQADEVAELIKGDGGFSLVLIHQDLGERKRVIEAQRR